MGKANHRSKEREIRAGSVALAEPPALAKAAPHPWWVYGGMAAIIVLLSLVVYSPSWPGEYIWDDDSWLTFNAQIRKGWSGLWTIWTEPMATPHYYPLIFTGFWIEHKLWGFWPIGYRVVNTLLQAGAAIALWPVLRRLGLRWGWVAALLFAIHPVQVESVAWVTERKNVLSALFFFLSILMYLRFERIGEPSATERRRSWKPYAWAMVFFICSLLSKPVTCVLPAVLIVLFWWKRSRVRWRDLWPTIPFFAVGLAIAGFAVLNEHGKVGTSGPAWDFSLSQRIVIAGRAVWFYLGKLIYPYPLVLVYPRWWGYKLPSATVIPVVDYLYPVGVAAALGVLWGLKRWIGKGPAAAWTCFIIILSPGLGFVNFYTMLYTYVADHYQHLACVAMLALLAETGGILLTWGGSWITRLSGGRAAMLSSGKLRITGGLLAAAMIASLSWQTYCQSRLYRWGIDLWEYTLSYSPGCFTVVNNYAGQLARYGHFQEAIAYYRRITDVMYPEDYRAWENLSQVYNFIGDKEQAAYYKVMAERRMRESTVEYVRYLNKAPLDQTPLPGEMIHLVEQADHLLANQKSSEAEAIYRQALIKFPSHAELWFRLMIALRQQNRMDEAKIAFDELLRLDPSGHTFASLAGNVQVPEPATAPAER